MVSKCSSCERFKTTSLHECVGIVEGEFSTCACECEKSDEALKAIESHKGDMGANVTRAFEELQKAIQASSSSYENFTSKMMKFTQATNTGGTNTGSWSSIV